MGKKAKSIAGEVIGDKHIFRVDYDNDFKHGENEFDIKLVKYRSYKDFSYFRNEKDFNKEFEEVDLNQFKAFKDIAEE